MFKTPIQYLSKKNKLSPNTIDDLQLDVLYNSMLGSSVSHSQSEPTSNVRQSWLDTYTTDTTFLTETQGLLSELSTSNTDTDTEPDKTDISVIKKLYFDIKNNKGFCEKYNFITLDYFKNLNSNPYALQLIGMYSLTSPILALLTPILLMIIPFFIIRVSGQKMELSTYFTELKNVLSTLPIGKLFKIREASSDQRGFILFSAILYCVQLYQNSVDCYKFYKNSRSIVNDLHLFGNYFGKTADTMKALSEKCPPSYEMFNTTLHTKLGQLQKLSCQYCAIKPNMFTDVGMKMKLYYDIHNDIELQELIEYSFDFHEYESNMKTLATVETMHACDFHPNKTYFSKSFHGILRNLTPKTNSYSLTDSNYILSGPNASGKTTMLKSTVINIILSQQHGKGFYQKAKIAPYHHFHCYINIPDTCDRDSLFQAEARRCHDILRRIQLYPQERHLCVFDELFSGTNPHEAEAAAVGYLQYLTKKANVRFILTTHYLNVCEHFKKNKVVKNFSLERKYKLSPGISRVRGGIEVLNELEFPQEILDTAKKMLSFD